MADAAANLRALRQENFGSIFIFHQRAIRRSARQHCALACGAMTSAAATRIMCGQIIMTAIPLRFVHWVHAVRSIECDAKAACRMAHRTLNHRARMALELLRGDIVVGIGAGIRPLGVGAAMTGFAFHSTVTLA